ncbi:MAG: type II toxin-antitoxin system prevent-host-death family antitoxin [Desulfatiglans sp.]|jgi:prevent-host-death family protein|nr:type II toxin-antitoxin system prevent-host-death family antitoxin [Desulfatiglans sp.]
MLEVNIRDARSNLSALLDRVETGEEIIIKRRGKTIAKIVSPQNNWKLPSLKDFRSSIKIGGKSMSQSIVDARKEDRF